MIYRALLLASLLCALGCGTSDQPPAPGTARLIERPPRDLFTDQLVGSNATLQAWDLRLTDERSPWRNPRGGAWEDGAGLRIESETVRLRFGSPLDVGTASRVVLDLSDAQGCSAVARWGSDGHLVSSGPAATTGTEIEIDLANDAEWAGTIDDLVLVVRGCEGRHLSRLALKGLGGGLDPGTAGDVLAAAWNVTLAADTREAILVLPGTTRNWPLPDGSSAERLSFSVGVTGDPTGPMTFRARSMTAAGAEVELAEVELSPAVWRKNRGWTDIDVELPPLPADSRITFEVTSGVHWQPGFGVPVIANPQLRSAPSRSDLNVLVLSIDTLRADHLSLYGYPLDTSPNIERRARESGVVFSNVVAPAGWTLPSHVSMFSGLTALRHGVNYATPAPPEIPLLADSFREAGYETAAFVGGGYLSPQFGLSRGFDRFRVRRSDDNAIRDSRRELTVGVEQFGDWLTQAREPFFALFHTYEVHGPFWIREPYFERFGGDPEAVPLGYAISRHRNAEGELDERRIVAPSGKRQARRLELPLEEDQVAALYDGGIGFMDAQIERIFLQLEAADLLDNTLVVLTSDHGESLGEHGLSGHGPIYDQVTQIPLIFWIPGLDGPIRIDEQVQLIDLAPTLFDLTAAAMDGQLDGVTLRPLWEGSDSYPQRPAWVHGGNYGVAMRVANRIKYIRKRTSWTDLAASEELFDLTQDPGETTNLATAGDERLSGARERLRTALEEQLVGLRWTLENRTAVDYEVFSHSQLTRRVSVTNLDCPPLRWRSAGRISLVLPGGSSCRLQFEHLAAGPMEFQVQAQEAGAPAVALELNSAEITEPSWYVLRDDVLVPEASPAADHLALRLEWTARPESSGGADAALDDALIEQLRALGYIE